MQNSKTNSNHLNAIKLKSNIIDKMRKNIRKTRPTSHLPLSYHLQEKQKENTEKICTFEHVPASEENDHLKAKREQLSQSAMESLGLVSHFTRTQSNELKEDRKTKILDLPNVRDEKQIFREQMEEVKKKYRRLAPSLDDLHKVILQWDLNTVQIPNESFLRRVPHLFNSVDEYIEIFEPLLLEEFRAQLDKAKDEDTFPSKKMKIKDIARVNDFHLITFYGQDAHHSFQDNELVIVSKDEIHSETLTKTSHVFGIIPKHPKEDRKKDEVQVKFFLQEKQIYRELLVNTEWYLKKIEKLSTMHREYQALHSLEYLHPDLLNTVLRPSSRLLNRGLLKHKLKTKLLKVFNPSQIDAIDVALSNDGFVLIQGPPGTGKTTVIEGILSVLLSNIISEEIEQSSANANVKGIRKAQDSENDGSDKKHILLVAPSNAAVDELVLRLHHHGLLFLSVKENHIALETYTPRNESSTGVSPWNRTEPFFRYDVTVGMYRFAPTVVRLGQSCSFLQEAKTKVQLEDIVEKIKAQNSHLITKRKESQPISFSDSEIMSLINVLSTKKSDEYSEIKTLELSVLNSASIICTTLSSSGLEILTRLNHGFDVVIVDEAAQAVELSCLIPLKYGCKRCIMIGDPQQLPATVMSQLALSLQYERSLFQRMKENNYPCVMLDIQYRMHPLIRQFPSEYFYDGRLTDGRKIKLERMTKDYHSHFIFRPLVFFDLKNAFETKTDSNSSLKNVKEAQFCALLVKHFVRIFFSNREMTETIGVITPYRQQVHELHSQLQEYFSGYKQFLQSIEVNTVDGFQGREKDIVVFSCVRAHQGKGIGFLADIRRMNVALTRAKFALWIVGNSKMLSQNTHWKRFADFVKKNDFLVEVDDIDKFFKHYLWRQTQQNVPSLKPMATERQNDDTSHPVGQHKRKLEENCAVSTVTKNNNESLKRQRCEQLSSVSEEREVFSASSKRTFLSSRHHLSIEKSNSNPPFDGTINKSVLKESHIEQ